MLFLLRRTRWMMVLQWSHEISWPCNWSPTVWRWWWEPWSPWRVRRTDERNKCSMMSREKNEFQSSREEEVFGCFFNETVEERTKRRGRQRRTEKYRHAKQCKGILIGPPPPPPTERKETATAKEKERKQQKAPGEKRKKKKIYTLLLRPFLFLHHSLLFFFQRGLFSLLLPSVWWKNMKFDTVSLLSCQHSFCFSFSSFLCVVALVLIGI